MANEKSRAQGKGEERLLSLFVNERAEDYAAIILAALFIFLIAVMPLSNVKMGPVNADMATVSQVQSAVDSGKSLDNTSPVKVAVAEAKKYNLKAKFNPDDPKKSDFSLFVPAKEDKKTYKPSGVAVVIVKHHYATQVAEYGMLLIQPDKTGKDGVWTVTKVGGKGGITKEFGNLKKAMDEKAKKA